MDEDDDAFLYGGDDEVPKAEASKDVSANGQVGGSLVPAAQESDVKAEQEEEKEEEESDEGSDEDEDSDSDLEIIVDGSAGPPAGYNARPAPPTRPTPVARPPPSAITSEYTPNLRPGQTSAVSSLAAVTGLDIGNSSASPGSSKIGSTAQTNGNDFLSMNELPEGPPPPVPITAPRLDLNPSDQSLLLPPETVDGEPGPIIYHIDPSEFDEKPWRRPGADMTDWFNYGFNEDSWRLWGEKKHARTADRRELEANGGRYDANVAEEEPVQVEQHNDNDASNNYMSQMPPQQLQAMQAMMGASGMAMSQEQMMAFMGMGSGGGMSGMGIPGGGMMGMPGIGGMFGQQNTNQGMFANGFGNMPNMQMLQQPFQRGTPPIGGIMRLGESSNGNSHLGEGNIVRSEADDGLRNDMNGTGADGLDEQGNGGHSFSADTTGENGLKAAPMAMGDRSISAGIAGLPPKPGSVAAVTSEPQRGGIAIQGRGTGVPGAPTGPSRAGSSVPKGPSADRVNATTGAVLPSNVPTGPKNPGRRYNDRDNGMGVADSLDYGGGQGGNREGSAGRSPINQRGEGRSSSLMRRQQSVESRSRDPSTERERERERDRERDRERERDWEESDSRSTRRSKVRTSDRRGHGSSEDEMERLSKRGPSSRRSDDRKSTTATSRSSRRFGDHRDDRRPSEGGEREDEWEKESITSTSSRRGHSSRSTGTTTRKSSNRSERRRGGGDDADSGEDTERDRKPDRSQLRSERRAGRDGEETKSTSTRKRSAPDDDLSPPRTTSSRRRR